jgi:hypothetical protein
MSRFKSIGLNFGILLLVYLLLYGLVFDDLSLKTFGSLLFTWILLTWVFNKWVIRK